MGMSIRAKLLYGVYYGDLVKNLTEEQIEDMDEMLDSGEIEYGSPYYDSDREDWFVGIELPQGFDYTKSCAFLGALLEAEEIFTQKFDRLGVVRAVQHVT